MKSILLASVSAFAFAGAAAAEVSFSGSADAWYNDGSTATGIEGVHTKVVISAAASVAGDWTLSTSAKLTSKDGAATGWTSGSVSLTDGTSTLTFGTDVQYGAFEAVKVAYTDTTTTSADWDTDVAVSTSMGDLAVSLTYDGAASGEGWQLGASAALGGFDVDFGYGITGSNEGDMALNASTSMGDLTLGVNMLSVNNTTTSDASVSYVMGDLTVSLASDNIAPNSDGDYDASIKYVMGDSTITASINEDQDYNVGVKWAAGGTTVSLAYYVDEDASANNHLRASASYALDGLKVALSTRTSDDRLSVDGSYDLGNGMTVFAGTRSQANRDENYAGVEATVGAAKVILSYSDTGAGKADTGTAFAKEYHEGTTLAVAFKF